MLLLVLLLVRRRSREHKQQDEALRTRGWVQSTPSLALARHYLTTCLPACLHVCPSLPPSPPLPASFSLCILQAAEAPSRLSGMTVDYVISSPFKRCLQTSAGLVRGLTGLKEGHWLVDWQLAEVRRGV